MSKKTKKASNRSGKFATPKEEIKVLDMELPELEKEDIKKFRIQFLLSIGLVLAGLFIFFNYRTFIGYYLGAIAIPYGLYGFFKPYKTAIEYAKDGYDMVYSRQFGILMVSLGALAIAFSFIYPTLDQNKWFMVVMLAYLALFFFSMSTLQKRYMKKPVLESQVRNNNSQNQ